MTDTEKVDLELPPLLKELRAHNFDDAADTIESLLTRVHDLENALADLDRYASVCHERLWPEVPKPHVRARALLRDRYFEDPAQTEKEEGS